MNFDIPLIKDDSFSLELFSLLSNNLSELKMSTGKWPDLVIFGGPLGKELISFIGEKGWDLSKFGIVHQGIVNKLIFEYSKPLDQIEDRGGTIFDSTLNGKMINGLPGRETLHKIISTYTIPAFTIERKVRPKIEIQLFRKYHE